WRDDSTLKTPGDSTRWIPYCTTRDPKIAILKDSAHYIARYKCHNTAFTIPGLDVQDTGYSYNNQRKLVYIGPDSLGRMWYRNVYCSGGRIYTAVGYHLRG